MIGNIQYQLIKRVCKLYDGKNYVEESQLRSTWKKCPEHDIILNLAAEEYLQVSQDLNNPAYIPTPSCLRAVSEHKRNTVLFLVGILTLAATIFFGLLQSNIF